MTMRVVTVLLLMLGGSVADASSGEHRGTLRGTLVQGDGAPLAGVVVRIASEETGAARSTRSRADGRFTIPQLEPGVYRLTVDGNDHRAFAARVEIRAGETTEQSWTATLPATSADVDVRSFFQRVDRAAPAHSTRLEGPFIRALPLDGHNVNDLVVLAPGIVTDAPGPFAAGTSLSSTAFLLDGQIGFDPFYGTLVVAPVPESIREMQITTPPLASPFGRSAGAQVTIVTRSGSNTTAGMGFAFHQNEAARTRLGALVGGPLKRNSTFYFGDFAHATADSAFGAEVESRQGSGRVDQVLGASGVLTGRFAATRGGPLERRGDIAGFSLAYTLSDSLTNVTRAGYNRLDFEVPWAGILPEFNALEVANVLSWTSGSHLLQFGGEYYGLRPDEGLGLSDENTLSGFVQDQWRASASLTVTAGLRFDQMSLLDADEGDGGDQSLIAPRVGVAWAPGADGPHVVTGAYGRHLQASGSVLDAWSVGLRRQMGRIRTIEAAYVGSRVDDEGRAPGTSPRYNALRLQLQQRSPTGLSAHVAYTFANWTVEGRAGDRVTSVFDSPHKVTAAFAWMLPFGPDGRWAKGGFAGAILRDLQVAGIFASQSGRPSINRNAPRGPAWRSADLAITREIAFGRRALEMRFEVFDLRNTSNPWPPLFGSGLEELFGPEDQVRRVQFGGRFRF